MDTLTCPKCQGAMRTYERNGVHVDQCSECRGIFLDRGELERLIDAEEKYHAPAPQQAPQKPQAGQLGAIVSEIARQAASSKSHSSHGYPHKRKSLLGELFG